MAVCKSDYLKTTRSQLWRMTVITAIFVVVLVLALGKNVIIGQRLNDKPIAFSLESFAQTPWFPLIQNYQVDDNTLTIYTSIYPDEDGKKLGQDIANMIAQIDNLKGMVRVYGLNITPYLLATLKN